MLDSDGYIYSRKKNDDIVLSSAWRCQKNKSLKCPGKCYLATDYHLDRLAVGKTPSKKKRISSSILYDLCSFYTTYPTKIEYLFAVAKYFGNNIE